MWKHIIQEKGRQSTISSLIDIQHPERMCAPMQLDSRFFLFKIENSQSLCE